MNEKNKEIIEEVLDEIDVTLKDPRGMYIHQRRIALSLSLGSVALIEIYLSKLGVLKPGYQINHQWFKKKKENVKKIIDGILITSLNNNQKFDKILDIVFDIEKERNDLAYGKKASEEKIRKEISLFLDVTARYNLAFQGEACREHPKIEHQSNHGFQAVVVHRFFDLKKEVEND